MNYSKQEVLKYSLLLLGKELTMAQGLNIPAIVGPWKARGAACSISDGLRRRADLTVMAACAAGVRTHGAMAPQTPPTGQKPPELEAILMLEDRWRQSLALAAPQYALASSVGLSPL